MAFQQTINSTEKLDGGQSPQMMLPISVSNSAAPPTSANGIDESFLNPIYREKLAYLQKDTREGSKIVNVWVYNFETELARITKLLEKYPLVAMDTEFPGTLESDFESGPED